MQQYQFAGNNKTAWDNLSMKEKAEMMRVAVRNGITNLSDIRQKYNEFAEGGNLYAGTSTDNDLVDWIIKEEGFLSKPEDIGDGVMTVGSGLTAKKWHDLYKARGNKWSAEDNRRAVAEEVASRRRWAEKNVPNWDTLPESSQKALLSYKYNYNFTKANSPKLFKALEDSNLYEAARQMDATSKNPKFRKGLQARRQREQEWFLKDVAEEAPKFMPPREYYHPTVSTAVYNPYVEQATVIPTFYEDEIIEPVQETPTERRMRDIQDVMRAYERFDALTKLLNIRSNPIPFVHPKSIIPILSDFGLIQGDEYKHGGKIHIVPSKKGTFTAAAKKHGMGVQEFASKVLSHPENYSPAMRKKANFARNASKWKHGLGGPLVDLALGNIYDGETMPTQQMITTGGAGYVPPVRDVSIKDIRRRLYDHITPASYLFPITRTISAVVDPSIVTEKTPGLFNNDALLRDDLFAEYLQIPKEERHKVTIPESYKRVHNDGKIEPTTLRPTNAEDAPHFKLKELHPIEQSQLIKFGKRLPVGTNKESSILGNFFGTHTVGHGLDNKGEYVSYYDKWDLAPFTFKGNDQSFGIGKPVHIYDRIYLDDYYGVPNSPHATYLPEVTVWGKKKAYGGPLVEAANIYDGTTENNQQMNIVSSWGTQKPFYEELADFNRQRELERQAQKEAIRKSLAQTQAIADKRVKDYLTTSNDAIYNNIVSKNSHLHDRAVEGAKSYAAWEKEHPNLTAWSYLPSAMTVGTALAPLGAAGWAGISALGDAAAATSVGQGITNFLAPIATTSVAGATVPQWFDLGLTSGFGAHGVQTAIDEGGISPMTAFEAAPLGRLATPMWNASKKGLQDVAKAADNIARYTSPSYDLYRTIVETTPKLEALNPVQRTVLGNSKINIPAISYDRFGNILTNPNFYYRRGWGIIDDAIETGRIRVPEGDYKKIALQKYPWLDNGNPFSTILKNHKFPYFSEGELWDSMAKFGRLPEDLIAVPNDIPGVKWVAGSKYGRLEPNNIPSEFGGRGTPLIDGETNMFPTNKALLYRLNPKTNKYELYAPETHNTISWKEASKTIAPQITAENATSITPEQWTAAQDAAIARGDMAEAQRLRDLHFKVSAPDNTLLDENSNPLSLYHFTDSRFTSFNPEYIGKHDDSFYGLGFYTSPNRDYASGYGPIEMKLYGYSKKPFKTNGDLNRSASSFYFGRISPDYKWAYDNADELLKADAVWQSGPSAMRNGHPIDEVVIPKGERLKSADAVTYDNNGVRIPLGERDNFKLNDTRYGLLPFIGLGTLGTMYGISDRR